MSEDKGGEYSKRLSAELKSSLYQRGQEGMGWDGGHMTPGDLQVCGFFVLFCLLISYGGIQLDVIMKIRILISSMISQLFRNCLVHILFLYSVIIYHK